MQIKNKQNTFSSAFSVDVEDGISLAMRDFFHKPMSQTNRVEKNTLELIELLDRKNTKATFFTLGMVGEDYPNLIKEIVNQGHELAVHGYNHFRFFKMTPKQALEEISKAKEMLQQISGVEIFGHRAPAFSISKNTPWAFDIIREAGFTYDSSIMPISSEYHGWKNFPKDIVHINTSNGKLTEFPITLLDIFGKSIPVSGGSYLRLLPYWFLKNAFSRITKHQHSMVYIHPYELDQEKYPDYYFKELNKKDFKTKLKLKSNFINRKESFKKLEKLIESFDFKTVKEIIENDKNIKSIKITDLF